METPLLTEIVQFNYTSIPAGDYEVQLHLHHYHQLDVILAGQVHISIEGFPPVEGTTGNAWLIPPLVRHRYESTTGYRQGSFKVHLAPRFWSLFGSRFRSFQIPDHIMVSIENAGERFNSHEPLALQQTAAVATLCLIECLDGMMTTPTKTDSLDEFRRVLWPLLERTEREADKAWTVQRMAAECHLSPDYFSRCFHEVVGQTPQRYIMETRMRTSAGMLVSIPAPTIKEVAERTGYASVPAFSRAFKSVFQVGPAAYRTATHDF
jgi:AraC-like DNA-binding protein